ncbi:MULTISPECIES: hypothetical protein [Bacillus]|uniref:hypothetical protein n=1 Tax=Bacillus TaxID=1386 RepID=UPI000AE2FB18|nr:hypothetical protein [Bacillus gobiensis]
MAVIIRKQLIDRRQTLIAIFKLLSKTVLTHNMRVIPLNYSYDKLLRQQFF